MILDRPKRKRAQVNYCETDPDSDQGENTAEEIDKDYLPSDAPPNDTRPANKKAKIQEEKNSPFPFMSLPPELRIMIYKYALVETKNELTLVASPSPFTTSAKRGIINWEGLNYYTETICSEPRATDHTQLCPALLSVNRQIHQEAAPFLYQQLITFEHALAMRTFLDTVGQANRLLLHKLALRAWLSTTRPLYSRSLMSAFAMLATTPNVSQIILEPGRDETLISSPSLYRQGAKQLKKCLQVYIQLMDFSKGKGAGKRLIEISERNFGAIQDMEKDPHLFKSKRVAFMNEWNS